MNCYKKDYPRPQLVRDEWTNLNGYWDFAFDDEDVGEREQWFRDFPKQRSILVPFTYETAKSGIGEENIHRDVWYHRTLEISEEKLQGSRCMLHFEGSDFLTRLWVNGTYAGEHRGGYSRFSFDITDLVCGGTNELAVKAEDSCDTQQPRGKQRWIGENFGCWYVQTTGIWKTVWLEYVPDVHLSGVKMTPHLSEQQLEAEYEIGTSGNPLEPGLVLETEVSFRGRLVSRTSFAVTKERQTMCLDMRTPDLPSTECSVHTWSPERPDLYDIEFRLLCDGRLLDRAGSYFAMREIQIDGSRILLNGRPLYQRLILDQGYWRDSHLTPPDEEALIEDIEKIRAMGYNGLRKHQKVEDERFLYWCDVKGMLVWSEAPAAYQYSDHAVELFAREWMEIVRQNYNHPCIITWTPFNESWGVNQIRNRRREQHFTEGIYHLTKSIDPYRPVITNDGWEHTVSDILTLHDYEEAGETLLRRYTDHRDEILSSEMPHCGHKKAFAEGYRYRGQPVIISEFGGIAFDNDDRGWGYGKKVKDSEDFLARFDAVTTAIKKLPYVCGYCYTQVTDVQQEINGLMDADRNFKVNPERIREINERRV